MSLKLITIWLRTDRSPPSPEESDARSIPPSCQLLPFLAPFLHTGGNRSAGTLANVLELDWEVKQGHLFLNASIFSLTFALGTTARAGKSYVRASSNVDKWRRNVSALANI